MRFKFFVSLILVISLSWIFIPPAQTETAPDYVFSGADWPAHVIAGKKTRITLWVENIDGDPYPDCLDGIVRVTLIKDYRLTFIENWVDLVSGFRDLDKDQETKRADRIISPFGPGERHGVGFNVAFLDAGDYYLSGLIEGPCDNNVSLLAEFNITVEPKKHKTKVKLSAKPKKIKPGNTVKLVVDLDLVTPLAPYSDDDNLLAPLVPQADHDILIKANGKTIKEATLTSRKDKISLKVKPKKTTIYTVEHPGHGQGYHPSYIHHGLSFDSSKSKVKVTVGKAKKKAKPKKKAKKK